jgi:hypothetical protein
MKSSTAAASERRNNSPRAPHAVVSGRTVEPTMRLLPWMSRNPLASIAAIDEASCAARLR